MDSLRVRRIPSVPTGGTLDPAYAQYLQATDVQRIDVRSPAEFAYGARAGAVNLPVEALCYGYGYHRLHKRRPVMLCGANEFHSRRAAHLLAGRGFSRIYYLANLDLAG